MNLLTKYEIGDFVYSLLDGMKQRKMQISEIIIFMDGGYKYFCRWYDEDNGGLNGTYFFEGELKSEEKE